jgi:TruD family tRNA pseudouridine synthase
MQKRNNIKEEEVKLLLQESKKNPELFERETFIDSPDFLEKIGIFFGKDSANLPRGYLKLWPQDFIVEEKSMYGKLETIDSEDLFNPKKNFSKNYPTVYATLVKCKLPTFEATKDLAESLNVEQKKIQYAGIKDADAITSQLISIRGVDIEKIKNISSPYYFLKNVYSGNGVVEIGSLKGNKFTVFIRINDNFNKEQLKQNLKKLEENGFYNFFYSQRFGSPRFINWFWGLLILRGEYKNAVLSYLCSEGQREISYFKNIRSEIKKNLENWDEIMKIIKPFPLILQNEIRVVEHLKKNPNDFIGALNQISKQVQLWIFAYGSLLFNRKISEYIENEFPLPDKLPLILSKDKNDWLPYYDFLQEDKISSLPLKNLTPFSDIQWKKREIKTREEVEIHKTEFIPEGIILSFSLPKGCYATTFLSHFFQLITGLPPKNISDKIIDTKLILGEKSLKKITEKFKEVTFSKTEDIFGKSE